MDSRRPSRASDGPSTEDISPPPPIRRRLSMEEDMFYQHIMTKTSSRRPSNPPPYESNEPVKRTEKPSPSPTPTTTTKARKKETKSKGRGKNKTQKPTPKPSSDSEIPPDYSTSIQIEGVFSKKHEIEDTTKRAEDRQWHTAFVTLNGNALNVYRVKKDWGWGRSRDGPTIDPDNPPWIKKSKLEKSYNLAHADAGIAADYYKRRYVIRIRAETDQFLLACVELQTFVKWLELLFAAIDITAPIDDRDFPRDMSIPRVQRIRWFRGVAPPRNDHSEISPQNSNPPQTGTQTATERPSSPPQERIARLALIETPTPVEPSHVPDTPNSGEESDALAPLAVVPTLQDVPGDEAAIESGDEDDGSDVDDEAAPSANGPSTPPPRIDTVHRLSTSSYPNLAINPHTGKWFPEHQWSSAHDLLYAKLCYSNLLFRSPRKSNFIIQQGKQWYVDWKTGRMVRVLPPHYAEINDFFGPWEVIHTENRRI